mmetsp:Transcript_111959/g.289320  ORF Transcript_111959/g.289320 Transcript_111959/m.289320 type:complete len:315 (+) Transcript_111959:1-945(+)
MQDSPLYPHLLREVVAEPLHRLLALRWEEVTGTSMEVTAANRKQCLDKLASKQGAAQVESLVKLAGVFSRGKDDKEAAKEAAKEVPAKEAKSKKGRRGQKGGDDEGDGDAAEAKEAADAAELYHNAANDCHIFCRKVDKKREKTILQEQKAAVREKLKDEATADAATICRLGLQMAGLTDGVAGLVFPGEPWALRLVAKTLASETVREKAVALCDLIDKGEDPVALEAAVAAWRELNLGGGPGSAGAGAGAVEKKGLKLGFLMRRFFGVSHFTSLASFPCNAATEMFSASCQDFCPKRNFLCQEDAKRKAACAV